MVHPTSAHSMEALARRAVDEAMAGGDLNGDGDISDVIVRYYRLP